MKIGIHPFVAAYRRLSFPTDQEVLTTMRGSLKAELLLLCEHPTQEEYDNNVPFSGLTAHVYNSIFQECDLALDYHFLVMPFSRFGPKPNKASTKDTLPFLVEHLDQTNVKCVVVIGMTVFGFTFAGGRKTHARSIIGNPMFLPQIGTRPVFVLPDSTLLEDVSSTNFKAMKRAEEKVRVIYNLTLNLRKFATEKLNLSL